MAIDDAIIDAKLSALKNQIRTLNTERQVLEEIETRLKQVRTVERLPAISGDPSIKEIPIDNQTGVKFTTQRRQSVYDQAITDADAVLV